MTDFKTKLQTEAERISLTPAEKSTMRAALSRAMAEPRLPVRSPYTAYRQVPRYALLCLLVAGVVSTGTVYAAHGSLPGDALYSVKVQVAEPLHGALQFSTQAKVSWHAGMALRRVQEAEVLAATGRLSPDNAQSIEANFGSHASAAADLAEKAQEEDSEQGAELSANIAAKLDAHNAVLAALGEASSDVVLRHTAGSLATRLSTRTQALLAVSPRETADEAEASARTTESAAEPTSPEAVVSMTMSASTTAEPEATQLATTVTTTAAVSAKETPQKIVRERAAATASVSILAGKLAKEGGALAPEVRSQLEAGLSEVQSLIAQGDTAVTAGTHTKAYSRAMRKAVSLSTYLEANASFPHANILPALLNTTDGQEGFEGRE